VIASSPVPYPPYCLPIHLSNALVSFDLWPLHPTMPLISKSPHFSVDPSIWKKIFKVSDRELKAVESRFGFERKLAVVTSPVTSPPSPRQSPPILPPAWRKGRPPFVCRAPPCHLSVTNQMPLTRDSPNVTVRRTVTAIVPVPLPRRWRASETAAQRGIPQKTRMLFLQHKMPLFLSYQALLATNRNTRKPHNAIQFPQSFFADVVNSGLSSALQKIV
jgi:hypothetical protein